MLPPGPAPTARAARPLRSAFSPLAVLGALLLASSPARAEQPTVQVASYASRPASAPANYPGGYYPAGQAAGYGYPSSSAGHQSPAGQAAAGYGYGYPTGSTGYQSQAGRPAWQMPAPTAHPYQGYYYPPAYYPQPASQGAPAPDQPGPGEDSEPCTVCFDLAVGTQVPLSLDAQATLELPGRLLLQAEIGWMPPGYGSAIAAMVGELTDSAYASELTDGVIGDAFVIRASGGWRPFTAHGFEMAAGYTYMALNGSLDPATAGSLTDSDQAELALEQLSENITIDSQLHSFHITLGWRWVIAEHLLIRASVGYTQAVASASSVEVPKHPKVSAADRQEINRQVDKGLDDVYTSNVKLPVLGLHAGYRF